MNTEPIVELYLLLAVYNYDASPRTEIVRHKVKTVGEASLLAGKLKKGIGATGTTSEWLQRNHNIDGFIESIGGLFQSTLVRIPLQ